MHASAPAHIDSYYAASVGPLPLWPPLSGDRSYDVCVIGGGLTGVSTALSLAEAGFDTVLLEARRIGWGASGRNGGQAQTGFGGEIDELEALVGQDATRALWDISVAGLALIEERCARHQIDCDLKHGYLLAAAKARNMAGHKAWVERAARVYGYDRLELLDRDAAHREVATDRYHGGILDHGSLHLHPLKYCLGLAKAAQAAGAVLHEASLVELIEPGRRVTVSTSTGTVYADWLVLACNAFPAPWQGDLETRIMPVGTYICATEPLDEDRAREASEQAVGAARPGVRLQESGRRPAHDRGQHRGHGRIPPHTDHQRGPAGEPGHDLMAHEVDDEAEAQDPHQQQRAA